MDCPRCKLMLVATDYEGVEVDMCDQCWGVWLDKGELEQVIDSRAMTFSSEEKAQLAGKRGGAAPAATAAVDPRGGEPAACPHCGKTMEQVHSDVAVQLVIDRCPEHGIWLDTGEIKAIQAIAETSADYHRLLIQKLGLRGR